MKKVITMLLLSLMLVSCSSKKEEKNTTETNTSEVKKEENKEDKKENKKENKKEEKKEEETTEQNGLKKTVIFTNKELNKTGESGSIKYNFTKIQVSKITATTDDAAQMFEVEKGKEFAIVVFDIEVENTSDKDVSFYVSQAKLISNTKEQVEPDMIASTYIDGEFLGAVKKKGTNVYLLKNSKAEDIKSVEIRISAPTDKNFNKLGEDIKFTIDIPN